MRNASNVWTEFAVKRPIAARLAVFALFAVIASFVVITVPSLAGAQGPPGMGGGFDRSRGPGKLAREPGITVPKQLNMINVLIEHRQELMLSDDQFLHVIRIKRAVDSTDAPLMRKLDSLQRVFKPMPLFKEPSPQRRDSLAEAQAVMLQTITGLREHLDEARDRAYQLLSSTQLARAGELEAKAQKEIDAEAKVPVRK